MEQALIKRLLLVVLPYLVPKPKDTKSKGVRSFLAFPYGVLTIASYVEKNLKTDSTIEILDLNRYPPEDAERIMSEALQKHCPDVVGFSMSYDISYRYVAPLTKFVKEFNPSAITVMGGPAVTTSYEEIILDQPNLDAVCYSEGEVGILELLGAKDPRAVLDLDPWATRKSVAEGKKPKTKYAKHLNDIIDVNYDLIDIKAYSMKEAFSPFVTYSERGDVRQFFIVTSRGCPFKCVFCAEPSLHGAKMRYVDVERIEGHVAFLKEKYGINVLTIYDDQLLMNRNRAKELFRRLVKYDLRIEMPNGVTLAYIDEDLAALMKQAGVDTIFLAIESGSEFVLNKIIRKPLAIKQVRPTIELLQRNDIFTCAFFVIGLPGEMPEHREETHNFIKDMGLDWAFFNYATPLRGSELFRLCKANKWVEDRYLKIGEVDMTNYIIRSPGIDPVELKNKMFDINLDTNFVTNRRMRVGDYQTAARCFREVLSRHEEQPFAHYFLAKAYEKLGKPLDLIRHHQKRFAEITTADLDWRRHAERFGLDLNV